MSDTDTNKAKAEYIQSLLKPGAVLEGLAATLIPSIKNKMDEFSRHEKRLDAMIEEATTIQKDMGAGKAIIRELAELLWNEHTKQQPTIPEPSNVKEIKPNKPKKSTGGKS